MTRSRTIALFALLTTVALLGGPAPPAALSEPASLPAAGAALCPTAALTPLPIPFCGEPCWVPGQSRGCIDDSGGFWVRVMCTCSGGSWVC